MMPCRARVASTGPCALHPALCKTAKVGPVPFVSRMTMKSDQASPSVWPASLAAAVEQFRSGRPVLLRDDSETQPRAYLVAAEECASAATLHSIVQAGTGLLCLLTTCKDATTIRLNPSLAAEFSLGLCVGTHGTKSGHSKNPTRKKIPIIPITERLEISSRPEKATRCGLALSCLAGRRPTVFFCQVTLSRLQDTQFGRNLSPLRTIHLQEIRAWCQACCSGKCK